MSGVGVSMALNDDVFFRVSEKWTIARCCPTLLLALLISPAADVMAENGLIAPEAREELAAGQAGASDVAESSDYAPTRLRPHWTAPQRAPMLGKAVAAEMAHAEEPGAVYGKVGRIEKLVEQPVMIDVVGAGLFISPIKDENHEPAMSEVQTLTNELPETATQVFELDDWTTAARIVVHSPDKDDRLPSKLNQLLLTSGASSVEHHEVDMKVKRDHIRFYHPSDHMYAIEVAAALDGVLDTLLVKDFSFMRPLPPEGLVEIWLR